MRKPTLTQLGIGAGAVATVALVWSVSDLGTQDLPLGRTAAGDTIDVSIVLPTADGITIGAEVRNGQKVIGRVSGMTMNASGASVQLSLAADSALPANTQAAVELPSALGNPFVRLSAPQPAGRVLRDGDVIPPDRTELGPQVESALATFGALLSRSGVDQLVTIVTELDEAFTGRSDKVLGLIESMSQLTAKAAEHQGAFDEAIALAADVAAEFDRHHHTVTGYLDALPPVVAMLDVQRAKLDSLFAATTALAATANNVLTGAELDAMITDADRIVATLGEFNDQLGATLTDMNTFLERFDAAVQGDYLVFDGALDIPGTLDKLLTGGVLVNGTPIGGHEAWETFLEGGYR
ncbi:MCE family protein [Mycolicibacterium thermoresistibile]